MLTTEDFGYWTLGRDNIVNSNQRITTSSSMTKPTVFTHARVRKNRFSTKTSAFLKLLVVGCRHHLDMDFMS